MPSAKVTGQVESLGWTQVRPGRFERTIDDLDSFFRFIASVGAPYGMQNWGVSSGIKYQTDRVDIVGELRDAWIATRYKHPNLASYVEDGRWVYEEIQGKADLQNWLLKTFVVHQTKQSARDLFGTFRPTETTILHVLPQTKEVLIQCPHTHADGLATVTIFDNIFKHITSEKKPTYTFGDEAKNLIGAFTTTAKTPQLTDEQKARWNAELGTWLQNMPTIGLSATNKTQPPGPSKVKALTLSKLETKALITASKAMGATPTHVAHTALAFAARIHGNTPNIKSHATLAIIAERDLCDLEASKIVTPHVTAVPVVVPLGSFADTVRNAKKVYTTTKAAQYSISVSPLFAHQIPEILSAPQPEPSSGVTLSSMGLLDNRLAADYSGVKLLDYWFTINLVTPDVVLYVWTFQGQITFEISYNGAYYQDKSVEYLLRLIKEQIAEGLKIELQQTKPAWWKRMLCFSGQ